jgi:DNA-binding CsgD family transcriptional regulator
MPIGAGGDDMGHWAARTARSPGLELSHQLSATVDRAEYLRSAAEMLMELLGGDFTGWNAVDLPRSRVEVQPFPLTGWDAEEVSRGLLEVADEHPLVRADLLGRSDGDVSPRRLSDVATRSELLRNRAYVDFLRPVGARHQIVVLTPRPSSGSGRAWAVNRSGRADFTGREVAAARAVQPVLAALDRVAGLPPPQPDGDAVGRMRLTAREAEVLHHVGAGLTADAVARLLRISTRTVCKHLENVYRKLDCHDRLVAVQRAQGLGLVPPPDTARDQGHRDQGRTCNCVQTGAVRRP